MTDRPLKHRSNLLTGTPGGADWARRAAARAMLRAVDFRRTTSPGRSSRWRALHERDPLQRPHTETGDILFREIVARGGKPFLFGTPVIRDGETMGMEGMKYS